MYVNYVCITTDSTKDVIVSFSGCFVTVGGKTRIRIRRLKHVVHL